MIENKRCIIKCFAFTFINIKYTLMLTTKPCVFVNSGSEIEHCKNLYVHIIEWFENQVQKRRKENTCIFIPSNIFFVCLKIVDYVIIICLSEIQMVRELNDTQKNE